MSPEVIRKNKKKTHRAGRGVAAKVIPFAKLVPDNVVPLLAVATPWVNFCPPAAGETFTVPVGYASEAELLAKVIPCRAAEAAPPHVTSGQDVGRIWLKEVIGAPWYDEHKEALVAMALDARRHCRHVFLISLGSLTETLASPREVFRPLIAAAAHSFILCHNHPSGNPEPSSQDKEMTKTMQDVGQIIGIPLLDSIIFGQPAAAGISYYSFRENKAL
jgi:hypothetical protein